MRIIFRADATCNIGTGHVLRSSVLAEEAILRGHECIFIGQVSELKWVEEKIRHLGFNQIFSQEDQFSPNKESDVLVLDSYSISPESSFISPDRWAYILSISDEVTPDYLADAYLRPSLVQRQEQISESISLSGPDYILIRKSLRKPVQRISQPRQNIILVVGGGSDYLGFTAAIAKILVSLKPSFEVHFFTNTPLPNYENTNFVSHLIGTELDYWIDHAELVLTTASTSSFEFIARELPIGVACGIENQKDLYRQLGELGFAIQIGAKDSDGNWDFDLEAIRNLIFNLDSRSTLKNSVHNLIDFRGAERVIDLLENRILSS